MLNTYPSVEGSPEAETPSDATMVEGASSERRSAEMSEPATATALKMSTAPPLPSPGLPLCTLVVDDDR